MQFLTFQASEIKSVFSSESEAFNYLKSFFLQFLCSVSAVLAVVAIDARFSAYFFLVPIESRVF